MEENSTGKKEEERKWLLSTHYVLRHGSYVTGTSYYGHHKPVIASILYSSHLYLWNQERANTDGILSNTWNFFLSGTLKSGKFYKQLWNKSISNNQLDERKEFVISGDRNKGSVNLRRLPWTSTHLSPLSSTASTATWRKVAVWMLSHLTLSSRAGGKKDAPRPPWQPCNPSSVPVSLGTEQSSSLPASRAC